MIPDELGLFAETKEQLVGFYLLEAKDLNEALQLVEYWDECHYSHPDAANQCGQTPPVQAHGQNR